MKRPFCIFALLLSLALTAWSNDTITYGYTQGQRTSLSLLENGASAWTQTYGYDSARRLQALAPSPGVFVRGPISVLQSFGKIDYRRVCNGGSLTLELSESLFRGRDAVRKVALFIRAFVQSGCQQLQLNTLNLETLRDAQRHPERHQNLVVRVWGWSGYFCDLDEAYQNQIIGRHIYGV